MNGFSERLKELMEENEIDAKKLAKLLNLPNTSKAYSIIRAIKSVSDILRIDGKVTISDYQKWYTQYINIKKENYEI